MRQLNYADICVAVSPRRSVSDRDKCLSVTAQAALATTSEFQKGAAAEGHRVLLAPHSGLKLANNNR